jgi:hypothetical protein
MADQMRFEGLELSDKRFELGGGGLSRDTKMEVQLGDKVEGTFSGTVVAIKFPLKGDTVLRVQTINIEDAEIVKITGHYRPEPKGEQQELKAVE